MKNSKITHKITQGVYTLTTQKGGCIVDAVARVGNRHDAPLIAVSVAKTNHSHQLLAESNRFALSVLSQKVDPEIIQVFGFNCSKDCDKLAQVKHHEEGAVPVLDDTLGYMVMEKVDAIDAGTHTIYIGKMIEGDVLDDGEPMSYAYYQEHKNDLVKTTTENKETAWVCMACGYVYYGAEVPEDYKCPVCGLGKKNFKLKDS